jgi:hypothetical protein
LAPSFDALSAPAPKSSKSFVRPILGPTTNVEILAFNRHRALAAATPAGNFLTKRKKRSKQ